MTKLTDAQRKTLERIVRTDDHDYITEYLRLSPPEKRMVAKLISMGLAKRVITKGYECIEPTPAGRAALQPTGYATVEDAMTAENKRFADEMAIQGYNAQLVSQTILSQPDPEEEDWDNIEAENEAQDERDVLGEDDDLSWDDPRAQAALNDIAAFVAGPQPAPDAPTADAATTFDELCDNVRAAQTAFYAAYDHDPKYDELLEALENAQTELTDFILDHVATIRAALSSAQPPALASGKDGVV